MPDSLTITRMPNQDVPTSAWADSVDQTRRGPGRARQPIFVAAPLSQVGISAHWGGDLHREPGRRDGRGGLFATRTTSRPRGNARPPCAFTLRPRPGRWTGKPWPIRWPPSWPWPPCGSSTPASHAFVPPNLQTGPVTHHAARWARHLGPLRNACSRTRRAESGGFSRRCGWWRTSISTPRTSTRRTLGWPTLWWPGMGRAVPWWAVSLAFSNGMIPGLPQPWADRFQHDLRIESQSLAVEPDFQRAADRLPSQTDAGATGPGRGGGSGGVDHGPPALCQCRTQLWQAAGHLHPFLTRT